MNHSKMSPNDNDEQDKDVKQYSVKKEYDDDRRWNKKSYNEKRYKRSSRSRSNSRERSDERPKKWRGDSGSRKSADTGMNSEDEREHRARVESRLGPSPTRRVVRKRSRYVFFVFKKCNLTHKLKLHNV